MIPFPPLDPLQQDRLSLAGLRRELDIRLDALATDTPIDPESIPALAASIGTLAARIAHEVRLRSIEANDRVVAA